MEVILWIFHGDAEVRINWSPQKCPYLVYLLQGAVGVFENDLILQHLQRPH